MEAEGVATICVGTDLASSKRAIEIAEMSPNIWAVVGQHPTDTNEAFDEAEYAKLAKHPKVVAIGECGFDFFRIPKDAMQQNTGQESGKTVFEIQKEMFLKHIALAQTSGKPLMIHARPSKAGLGNNGMDAYEETLKILSSFPEVRANFHFFVGDKVIAQKSLEAGHTMSFDGPITFTDEYDEVIKMLPLSSIMAETDSPFATPEPYRSADRKQRAEPWMVKDIVKKIAEIRAEDEETVRKAMLENAKQFFKILL